VFLSAPAGPRTAPWQALQTSGAAIASALLLSVALLLIGSTAQARDALPDARTGVPLVALATLPAQAQTTHRLIFKGGPFPYEKDSTVFFNREQILPSKTRGHYREYTVKTPGTRSRGARRIVCGGQPPTQPEVCFYTADHYASFSRIVP
jgi:ribonuclease T1